MFHIQYEADVDELNAWLDIGPAFKDLRQAKKALEDRMTSGNWSTNTNYRIVERIPQWTVYTRNKVKV